MTATVDGDDGRLTGRLALSAEPVGPVEVRVAGQGVAASVRRDVDDGWAAAANWPEVQRRAGTLIDQADRADRRVVLITTAAGGPAEPATLLRATEARGRVAGLTPKPWPTILSRSDSWGI